MRKNYIYYYQHFDNGVFFKRKANIQKIFNCIKEDTNIDDKLINNFIEQLIIATENPTTVKFNNLYCLINNLIYSNEDKRHYKYYKFILNFYNTRLLYMNKLNTNVIL